MSASTACYITPYNTVCEELSSSSSIIIINIAIIIIIITWCFHYQYMHNLPIHTLSEKLTIANLDCLTLSSLSPLTFPLI